MGAILVFILDIALIGLLSVGIFYAVRLTRQIAGLRANRSEMEQFVLDFSSTVQRAESGIRGLKQAARTSGDDLEQLIEKAQTLRDELHYLIESADQLANRLSDKATTMSRSSAAEAALAAVATEVGKGASPETKSARAASIKPAPVAYEKKVSAAADMPTSTAEKELLQALKKLG